MPRPVLLHACTLRAAARAGAVALLAALGLPAAAQAPAGAERGLGIAAFNLAWAGTEADYARHAEVCGAPAVAWCDSRPRTPRGASAPLDTERERARACQAAFQQAAGGAAAAQQVAPCNAYRMTAQRHAAQGPAAYAGKLEGLRQTVDQLVSQQGIDVIAFQEVRSEAAIRAVLGRHAADFDTCAAPHTAFQTLGFAWRRGIASAARCSAEPALAVDDGMPEPGADPGARRTVRPGLALRLTVGGAPLALLNLHLKSGCANIVATERFPARELTDPEAPCQVLNRQVAPLERWIEAVAADTPLFVVLGDFNRRLDEEAARAVPPAEVRSDGRPPASPHQPAADGRVSTRFLWPELADGQPDLVLVPLTQRTGCTGFTGLDHLVLSGALAARQPQPLQSTKWPVVQLPEPALQSSDHCPRGMRLRL